MNGKVALITGAADGIGAACARSLAERGNAVIVHYHRNQQSAERVVSDIVAAGGIASTISGDLTDPAAADRICRETAERHGSIDILVNNSGAIVHVHLAELTPEILLSQFQINAFSVFYMVRAVVDHMPELGGAIINISSNLTTNCIPGAVAYSAAKAAVENMTLGFSKELAPKRITVNAVAPGATRTAMTAHISPDEEAALAARTPFGRMGEPRDIAGVVAFLASPEARWLTGISILADGGLTMSAL